MQPMPNVKFVGLFLLSRSERRALKVPLNASRIVIQGGNGFGKSAIIKSIYAALGATPQKIDNRWKSASVSSALVFEYQGKRFTSVRALGMHALFDADRRLIFSGQQIMRDWAPQLAQFFGFKLMMSDREGEIVIPPPSYIFAPFYVDQDTGWTTAWRSFHDLFLPESTRTLAEYHSGLKPDAYYEAKANLAFDRIALSALEASVGTLRDAITQIQNIDEGGSPTYDLGEFKSEVDDLVRESEVLLAQQRAYRGAISDLHEESHLLRAEKALLEGALREQRQEFDAAAVLPDEVECPTCGQGYSNHLADRFALIADEGVLIEAIGVATSKLDEITRREQEQQEKLREIEKSLARIERILDVERAALSFHDVVIAAGKTEAAKILRSSLGEKAADADDARDRVAGHKATMVKLTSSRRSAEILNFYRERLSEYALALDVTLDGAAPQSITAIQAARGSEGPRGLLAYYYAFLQTRAVFTDATSYPIVIDAPNQQGQDAVHLPQMLDFIFNRAPEGSQVIVAAEEAGQGLPNDVEIRSYGERKRQVLREAEFEEVRDRFAAYTNQMIAE
jgi:predicted  nucleic acid-binding Zn-ribbon protein